MYKYFYHICFELFCVSNIFLILEAASSLCARLSQSELSSSQSDAMQDFFVQVVSSTFNLCLYLS